MKYLYIVAAAGTGKRMGMKKPKQFLEYGNEPIFIKTLKVIENSKKVDEIIVVTGEEFIDKVKEYCKTFKIKKLVNVVAGGKERQDSVNNVLKTIKNPQDYIIAVQDGVRPFIKEDFINGAYDTLLKEEIDGIVTAVPVKDTVKVIDENGFIVKTPKRSSIYLAQSPQVFKGEVLKKAYELAEKEEFLGTDDSSLVERIGGKVKVLEGSYDNIKITTVEDLIYFTDK